MYALSKAVISLYSLFEALNFNYSTCKIGWVFRYIRVWYKVEVPSSAFQSAFP